jgi:hypothetical protein
VSGTGAHKRICAEKCATANRPSPRWPERVTSHAFNGTAARRRRTASSLLLKSQGERRSNSKRVIASESPSEERSASASGRTAQRRPQGAGCRCRSRTGGIGTRRRAGCSEMRSRRRSNFTMRFMRAGLAPKQNVVRHRRRSYSCWGARNVQTVRILENRLVPVGRDVTENGAAGCASRVRRSGGPGLVAGPDQQEGEAVGSRINVRLD